MKPRSFVKRHAGSLLGILLCSVAWTALHAQSPWQGSCDIRFAGTSTLHDFSGTVSAEPFQVKVSGLDDPATAKMAAVVKVKAANMDTAKPKRDKKMHDAMDVTTFTEVSVTLPKTMNTAITKPVMENSQPRPTQIPFALTIMGNDQQMLGTVSDWKHNNGIASFKVSFSVSLKASGIAVPAVLGVIRVGDEVKVVATLVLKSPAAVAAAGAPASSPSTTESAIQ